MIVAVADCKEPYNKEELKKQIIKLISKSQPCSFIMSCYNKTAKEVMKETKNIYPDLEFSVINCTGEKDRDLLPYYVNIEMNKTVPKNLMLFKINKYFFEICDILISQTEQNICLFYNDK